MPRLSLIAVITFSSVVFSAVLSIVWFFTISGASRFAPVVHLFGLLGGLTGVLVGRRAAARERRHLALAALMDELRRDAAILADRQYAPSQETPRPRVYPRLPVSATDAALTLGALAERSDDELLQRLHNWRDEVNGFNGRLELTEFLGFSSRNPAEIAEFERALHRDDGYLHQIRDHLRELRDYLAVNYQVTSETSEARHVVARSCRAAWGRPRPAAQRSGSSSVSPEPSLATWDQPAGTADDRRSGPP